MRYKSIITEGPFQTLLVFTLAVLLVMAVGVTLDVSAAPQRTDVGGGINTNTTWTLAGSPYNVVNNVSVSPGATLTIQPGVEVRFKPNTRLRIEGKLIAQGNPANPIRFTSETTEGYPGYWSGIFFKDTGGTKDIEKIFETGAGNILQYCVVEYAGANEGAVRIQNSATLVDHCTVRNNSNGGILVISNPGLAVGISNNHVSFNSYAGSGAGILGIESSITDNTVLHNSAGGSGGGIFAVDSTVRDNIVGFNKAVNDGGGIYASNSFVSGNFIYNNSGDEAGGILSLNSTFFSGNTVVRNQSGRVGAGVYYLGSGQFTQNTVVGNTTAAGFAYGGVAISGAPTINNNNFYSNGPFDLVILSATNINGENNYWGTTDTGTILGRIFDKNDDLSRGLVDFQPFLADATSPLPPPINLQASFAGSSANLSWNALPGSSTVYGYKIYYDSDGIPPFNGTGLPQGNSPIDVGAVNNFTLNGVTSGIVVVVTAYDQVGQESWYSNKVDNLVRLYLPIATR